MVVENHKSNDTTKNQNSGGENSGLYRPPQIRMQNNQRPHRDNPIKIRRPDRAVYVPKARRTVPTPNSPAALSVTESPLTTFNDPVQQTETETHLIPLFKNSKIVVSPKSKRALDKNYCNVYKPPHARTSNVTCSENNPSIRNVHIDFNESLPRTTPCDSSTKVPHKVTSNNVPINKSLPLIDSVIDENYTKEEPLVSDSVSDPTTFEADCNSSEIVSNSLYNNVINQNLYLQNDANSIASLAPSSEHFNHFTFNSSEYITPIDNNVINSDHCDNFQNLLIHNDKNIQCENIQSPPIINDSYSIMDTDLLIDKKKDWIDEKDEDKEQKELIKASEEINRSNRRLIKQSFVSDVLIISDHSEQKENPVDFSETKSVNDFDEKQSDDNGKETVKQKAYNPEEEDWEAMFDENGEWLGSDLMMELTTAVGQVSVQKPRVSYSSYLTNTPQAFSHVLEVYNFPTEFTANDLYSVFSDFKDTGFEIKWVDDNHALAVFSSAEIAAQVLAYNHSLVKTRPLHEATQESRTKAKRSAEFLRPYKPRPETCTALARRLVSVALGVKLPNQEQERIEEKQKIFLAKEKKRLAAMHREAAWEGSLTSDM